MSVFEWKIRKGGKSELQRASVDKIHALFFSLALSLSSVAHTAYQACCDDDGTHHTNSKKKKKTTHISRFNAIVAFVLLHVALNKYYDDGDHHQHRGRCFRYTQRRHLVFHIKILNTH